MYRRQQLKVIRMDDIGCGNGDFPKALPTDTSPSSHDALEAREM